LTGEQPVPAKERPGRKPRAKNVQEKAEGAAALQTPEKEHPGEPERMIAPEAGGVSNSSGVKQKK
jgi:hypothetical protein